MAGIGQIAEVAQSENSRISYIAPSPAYCALIGPSFIIRHQVKAPSSPRSRRAATIGDTAPMIPATTVRSIVHPLEMLGGPSRPPSSPRRRRGVKGEGASRDRTGVKGKAVSITFEKKARPLSQERPRFLCDLTYLRKLAPPGYGSGTSFSVNGTSTLSILRPR